MAMRTMSASGSVASSMRRSSPSEPEESAVRARGKLTGGLSESIAITMGGKSHDLHAIGDVSSDLAGALSDRAGGSEDDDAAGLS